MTVTARIKTAAARTDDGFKSRRTHRRSLLRTQVKLIGVEAGGDGMDTERHSATLARGTPGVLHGTRTYLLQNNTTGQINETHSISAGLDYPGAPGHA